MSYLHCPYCKNRINSGKEQWRQCPEGNRFSGTAKAAVAEQHWTLLDKPEACYIVLTANVPLPKRFKLQDCKLKSKTRGVLPTTGTKLHLLCKDVVKTLLGIVYKHYSQVVAINFVRIVGKRDYPSLSAIRNHGRSYTMTLETPEKIIQKFQSTWSAKRVSRKDAESIAHLEKMFYLYPKIREAVEAARYYMRHCNYYYIRHYRHCLPLASVKIETGKYSVKIIYAPELWMIVVKHTLARYLCDPEPIRELFLRRYFDQEPQAETCEALNISRDKYYRLRDTGMRFARECAIQLGLVKVF